MHNNICVGSNRTPLSRMKVKSKCGTTVLAAETKCANLHNEKCILLANTMLPELAEILFIQRGEFYGFGTDESEFPVLEQVVHVDKGRTYNLQMERQCGDHDNRLIKKCNISTVSRDNIIKKCTGLRHESSEIFRVILSRKVKVIEEIKKQRNDRQGKLKAAGLSAKEIMQLAKKDRKMKILNIVKKDGGPFTSTEEIDEYMESKIADQIKQQRMKNENTFARDSTRSISAAVTLFRFFNSF